jgi:hypothetical protein
MNAMLLTCPDCIWGREARAHFWADAALYLPSLLLPFALVALLGRWLERRS